MNRGNRKIIVASIILTLPLAILLESFSNGAPPFKAAHRSPASSGMAVAPARTAMTQVSQRQHGAYQPNQMQSMTTNRSMIRQVAGTAPLSVPEASVAGESSVAGEANAGSTSAGEISQAFATPNQAGADDTEAVEGDDLSVVPTAGVFDGIVDVLSPSSKKRSTTHQHQHRPAPNWNGIPFHSPEANKTALKQAPIRDPSETSSNTSQRQFATSRTQSSRQSTATSTSSRKSLQARPASSRISGSSSVVKRQQSTEDLEPLPSARRSQKELSTTTSSRRQGRQVLSALDPSEIAAAATTLNAIASDAKLNKDLVPKAARRLITGSIQSKTDDAMSTLADAKSAVAEKAQAELDAIKSKVAQQLPSQSNIPSTPSDMQLAPLRAAQDQVKAQTVAQKVPQTVSPTPGPAMLRKPEPMTLQIAPKPDDTAGVPSAQQRTLPAGPTNSIAPSQPAMQIQAPSLSASHRVGNQFAGPSSNAFDSQAPRTVRAGTPRSQTVFTPIGSGVVDSHDYESQSTTTSPERVDAPRIAQTPRNLPHYAPGYGRDPYMANQQPSQPYQSTTPSIESVYGPPSNVAHPMRAENSAVPPLGSGFQTRDSRVIPNGMRPPTSTPTASPTQPINSSDVASELPGIRVVTHGPKHITIRQSYQFEIRVENRGSIDASGVMVRAIIPDWASVQGQSASRGGISPQKLGGQEKLVWTINDLPAGSSEKMLVRLKAERSGTHGMDVDWTLTPQKSVTKIEVREPRLELNIEGPEEVIFGQSQTYRVRVLNPGDGVAPNVVFTLSPDSPTPQTQRIGDIPPGKEAQFEVELTAQDLGDLRIAGLASGDLDLSANASKTIRVSAARLEAMLTGPELKYQDTDANYNLELQNKGVATSEKIIATLQLPPGVRYLGGLDKATQRGSTLQWEVSSLPPSAVRNYQFKCKMASTGDQNFEFDCKGSAAGMATVSLVTRVQSIADLVMTISDPAAPAPVGADVTYEITIRNRGSKAATDVRAIAQFSHGIEPRRVEGQSGELLTGQVLFDPIASIGPGDEIHLKVVANASRPGHHRFRSEIRSGDTILVSEEATHYMNPKSERVSRRSSETQTQTR